MGGHVAVIRIGAGRDSNKCVLQGVVWLDEDAVKGMVVVGKEARSFRMMFRSRRAC